MRYPYDNYTITCPYGKKGKLWSLGYHTGTDFVGKEKEVKSICSGIVRVVAYSPKDYGNYVTVQTNDNKRVLYCHLKETKVKTGYPIMEGEVIGIEGNTGNSTGAHLHLEVRVSPYNYKNNIDPVKYIEDANKKFTYENKNGIYTIKTPVDNFKILNWNKAKKTTKVKNYCNGGFFASGKTTTEAMGNLIIDEKVISETINSYGNLARQKLHTICITKDNKIELHICNQLERDKYKYAISGLPVTLDGEDVSWSKVVKPQGWTGGELRATKHICISYDDHYIYIFGISTKASNPASAITEIWKKLKSYNLPNILLLDGGGSYVIDVDGKNVDVTNENRVVHNLLSYD